MGIRIPIHPAFLDNTEDVIDIFEEKLKSLMPKASKKKIVEEWMELTFRKDL